MTMDSALNSCGSQWPQDDAAEAQFNRLNALFLTKPRDVWVAELEPADIPFSAVYDVGEAFDDPQLKARDMMLSVDHPVEGTIPQLGFPIKLSGTPCAITAPPPTLGQHNAELLGDLGLDDADIARLAETNVI